MHSRNKLARLAYREFKITRQISTGNGETFLAAGARAPGGFIMAELGFGLHERPCTDCHKPCTLDYTLANLDEINRNNLRDLNKRDPLAVPDRISSIPGSVREHFRLSPPPAATVANPHHQQHQHHEHSHRKRKLSAGEARRILRAQAARAGVRVVRGQYVDERPKQWVPQDPNRLGRRARRADKLITEHRARAANAAE
jgi:hypothetical protein